MAESGTCFFASPSFWANIQKKAVIIMKAVYLEVFVCLTLTVLERMSHLSSPLTASALSANFRLSCEA